jgi:hypothetical protein
VLQWYPIVSPIRNGLPIHTVIPRPENSEQEAQLLANKLATLALQLENKQLPPVPDVSFLSWSALQKNYDELLNELKLLKRDN